MRYEKENPSMTDWHLYNNYGKLSEKPYTEEMARALLEQDLLGNVYAENSAGDFIETHDGPTHVGVAGKWYVYDNAEQTVATRVTEDRARELLWKNPSYFAKCPATSESITSCDGPRTVESSPK